MKVFFINLEFNRLKNIYLVFHVIKIVNLLKKKKIKKFLFKK